MRKILFIMPDLFLGGAETQYRHILKSIDKNNYNVTVMVANGIDKESKFIKENSEINYIDLNVNLAYYQEKYKNNKIKRYLNYIYIYIRIIKKIITYQIKEKYDVVLSYDWFFAPIIPVLKLLKIKVIFSERSADDKILKKKFIGKFFNMADIMTCNSPYTKELLARINVKNVKVIYNGIEIVESEKYIKDNDLKNIYIIARISPDKNQMIMLEAMKNMENINLFFVGKIQDNEYYKKLVQFIKKNGLDERVKFVQYTHNIKDIYKKADLIVLPSFNEGMANVILEAFLYKKYCIASDIPTNKILLDNGRGGTFNPNNSTELIDAIDKYKNMDINKKDELLESNYKYLKENFSLSKMTSQYNELINILID